MTHFRGRPNDAQTAWLPLCGSKADSVPALTTEPFRATCPECREILGFGRENKRIDREQSK